MIQPFWRQRFDVEAAVTCACAQVGAGCALPYWIVPNAATFKRFAPIEL
jgi:hypothetical protein